MIQIDPNRCTSCGLCAEICETRDIAMGDNGPLPLGLDCSECGHCVAICPADAVTLVGYDQGEIIPYDEDQFCIPPDNLMNFMKFRRSTRRFSVRKPQQELIETILEAGRYSPTACNAQLLRYVVVEKDLKHVRDMLWDGAAVYARKAKDEYLLGRHKEYLVSGGEKDALLYGCSHLIFILGPDENDASIASSRMELMANALGLGALYLGYCKLAVEASSDLQKFLSETRGSRTQIVLAVGYPDVIWRRTVPRKPLQVQWK